MLIVVVCFFFVIRCMVNARLCVLLYIVSKRHKTKTLFLVFMLQN